MGILNYLPTFKVVEINRSFGLVAGHVLTQFKGDVTALALKTVNTKYKFLENGVIVGLANDLTIGNFDATKMKQPFLNYVEEITTLGIGDALNRYATEVINDEVYPRAIALMVGDVFTTDNYTLGKEGEVGAEVAIALADAKFAKVVNGVMELYTTAVEGTLFAVEATVLPDGKTDAVRATYLGI